MLAGGDPEPIVRRVFDVPVVRPHVVEYHAHRLKCPRCGASTCGDLPDEAGLGYGPRAQAVCAALSGEGRLSKRRVARVMRSLFGSASVCDLERRTAEALAPIHAEVLERIRELPADVDEASRRQGRDRGWLWTAAATARLAAFLFAEGRSRDSLIFGR